MGTLWQAYAHRVSALFPEAERDPFSPELPPALPTPVAAAAPAPLPPPPPPPSAPIPQFRIVGWFGVAGEPRQLLLTDGQTEVVARVGLNLPDGFVVQTINERQLVLRHPASQADYALSLPASLAESR